MEYFLEINDLKTHKLRCILPVLITIFKLLMELPLNCRPISMAGDKWMFTDKPNILVYFNSVLIKECCENKTATVYTEISKMKTILFFIQFAIFSICSAQFYHPNASAYNANTNKYYITNYLGKNVVSLSSSGIKDTFISGLTAPNNILFEALPLGSAFVVLDSNEIKAYDSAGAYFGSFSTPGALKLQDAVFDNSKGILYITDVLRGVIYKTTFSGPPFYIPSTSIFATPFRRPSAIILQASKNRLLYVEDTLSANLMACDLSTGNISIVKSTGLNNLVGLAEDGQGNLYISSQGNKAIYQWNKYYSGSPVKLYSEPKPGDITVNVAKDQWVYTCLICGTVFTPPLHIFGPGNEIAGCKGDSFTSFKNYLMRNIGTFDKGNQFIMELSNSSGTWNKPTVLSTISDTLVPAEMTGIIPKIGNSGAGYKLRWRSTKPAIVGASETLEILPNPPAEAANADTFLACTGATIILGKGNPSDTQYHYKWWPVGTLNKTDTASVVHTAYKPLKIYMRVISTFGCVTTDSVWIDTISKPNPGLIQDTLYACRNTNIALGAAMKGGLSYLWSPGNLLSDSAAATPLYNANLEMQFQLHVEGGGGCSADFKQFVRIKENPDFSILNKNVALCFGDSFKFSTTYNKPSKTIWISEQSDTIRRDTLIQYWAKTGKYTVWVTDSISQCSSQDTVLAVIIPYYSIKIINLADTTLYLFHNLNNAKWYRNDTLLQDTGRAINYYLSGNYKACGYTNQGCFQCSRTDYFVGRNNPTKGNITLERERYVVKPNPAGNKIWIEGSVPAVRWELRTSEGGLHSKGQGKEVDLTHCKSGIYFLRINEHKMVTFVKL